MPTLPTTLCSNPPHPPRVSRALTPGLGPGAPSQPTEWDAPPTFALGGTWPKTRLSLPLFFSPARATAYNAAPAQIRQAARRGPMLSVRVKGLSAIMRSPPARSLSKPRQAAFAATCLTLYRSSCWGGWRWTEACRSAAWPRPDARRCNAGRSSRRSDRHSRNSRACHFAGSQGVLSRGRL